MFGMNRVKVLSFVKLKQLISDKAVGCLLATKRTYLELWSGWSLIKLKLCFYIFCGKRYANLNRTTESDLYKLHKSNKGRTYVNPPIKIPLTAFPEKNAFLGAAVTGLKTSD